MGKSIPMTVRNHGRRLGSTSPLSPGYRVPVTVIAPSALTVNEVSAKPHSSALTASSGLDVGGGGKMRPLLSAVVLRFELSLNGFLGIVSLIRIPRPQSMSIPVAGSTGKSVTRADSLL